MAATASSRPSPVAAETRRVSTPGEDGRGARCVRRDRDDPPCSAATIRGMSENPSSPSSPFTVSARASRRESDASTTLEQQGRCRDLLDGGAERFDEVCGQIVDEADRVGEQAPSRSTGTRSRRFVGSRVSNIRLPGGHPAPGQPVQQRGLSRVGVADERNHRQPRGPPRRLRRTSRASPPPPQGRAAGARDPFAGPPAVHFEARLAGAAPADAAPEPRQRGCPRWTTPRQAVGAVAPVPTCSLPSRLWARRAKTSRMSWVRSSTLRSVAREMFRACDGLRSQEKRIRSAARSSAPGSRALSSLPPSEQGPGDRAGDAAGATVSTNHTDRRRGPDRRVRRRAPSRAASRSPTPTRMARAREPPAGAFGRQPGEVAFEIGDQFAGSRAAAGRGERARAVARAVRPGRAPRRAGPGGGDGRRGPARAVRRNRR